MPVAVLPAAVDDQDACAPSFGIAGHEIWLQSGDGVFHSPVNEQLRVVEPVKPAAHVPDAEYPA